MTKVSRIFDTTFSSEALGQAFLCPLGASFISAPEAKGSSPAVTAFGGGRQAPIQPPIGSALDAITVNKIASTIRQPQVAVHKWDCAFS